MSDNKKIIRKNLLTAKLTIFDWGWADNIIYNLRARTSEKTKGIMMLEKIKEIFGINDYDVYNHEENEIKAQQKIQKIEWTRDEDGRIISPFKKKDSKGFK